MKIRVHSTLHVRVHVHVAEVVVEEEKKGRKPRTDTPHP